MKISGFFKKRNIIIAVIVVITINAIFLHGYAVVGTWEDGTGYRLEFNANGTYEALKGDSRIQCYSGKYAISYNQIKFNPNCIRCDRHPELCEEDISGIKFNATYTKMTIKKPSCSKVDECVTTLQRVFIDLSQIDEPNNLMKSTVNIRLIIGILIIFIIILLIILIKYFIEWYNRIK